MDKRIIELNNLFQASGLSLTDIAKETGISISTVGRYVKKEVIRIKEDYYEKIYSTISKSITSSTDIKQMQVDLVKNDLLKSRCEKSQNNYSNFVRNPRRGDIFYIRNNAATGNEIFGSRPGVVVSNNKLNEFSGVLEICYITSKPKSPMPTHVNVKTNRDTSIVLCEQIYTVSRDRLNNFMCSVTEDEMNNIEKALLLSLGINNSNSSKANQNQISTISFEVLKAQMEFYKDFYENVMKINMIKAESFSLMGTIQAPGM